MTCNCRRRRDNKSEYDTPLRVKRKVEKERKRKVGGYAMKRVAAVSHHLTSCFFEPAKRPEDRVDYCRCCRYVMKYDT